MYIISELLDKNIFISEDILYDINNEMCFVLFCNNINFRLFNKFKKIK